jgi:hypothetical protein
MAKCRRLCGWFGFFGELLLAEKMRHAKATSAALQTKLMAPTAKEKNHTNFLPIVFSRDFGHVYVANTASNTNIRK